MRFPFGQCSLFLLTDYDSIFRHSDTLTKHSCVNSRNTIAAAGQRLFGNNSFPEAENTIMEQMISVLPVQGLHNTQQVKRQKTSMASVYKRIIPTERPPHVSEVSANFFADRGCHVDSVTNPYGRILGFLYRSRYVDPVPGPLLFSCSAWESNPGPPDL
jgi:hypothetical protein